MKTRYKVLTSLLIGVCLIGIGISMGGLNQLSFYSLKGIDIRMDASSIDDVEMYCERVDEIDIKGSHVAINVYEDETINNIYIKATHLYDGFELKKEVNSIEIEQPQYWWKKYNNYQAQVNIYVPKDYVFDEIECDVGIGESSLNGIQAKTIKLDVGLGKMNLNSITCKKLEIDTGLGQTVGNQIHCQKQLKVSAGMGAVDLAVVDLTRGYDYKVDVGLGNVIIDQKEFSGITDQKSIGSSSFLIDVDCGMGKVSINREDVNNE
ncbi:MAG: DUF4097 family beta strand repeat-containing protein [Faecalibacillus sp.]